MNHPQMAALSACCLANHWPCKCFSAKACTLWVQHKARNLKQIKAKGMELGRMTPMLKLYKILPAF